MQFKLPLIGTAIVVMCIYYSKSNAQSANQNMNPTSATPLNTYMTNFVQPAPNAGSLGKYADFPVGYYTGVPNISVPIYNLKDGGINLPISLSYHASGIKVSELASWVGLGWALNATGVITRTVRGAPDEGTRKSSYGPLGYYKSGGLMNLSPIMNYPTGSDNHPSDPSGIFYQTITQGLLTGGGDGEPDLFTFNFNGHTGKFVFDEKGNVRLLEDDNLKVKVSFDSTNNYFKSWVITTEDGVQYYFGENYAIELTRPKGNGMEDQNDQVPTSWYLTRIVNPNTKETAVFNYTYEGYSYYDLGPESKLYGAVSGFQTSISYVNDNENTNKTSVDNLITTTIQGLKLVSIVTNNYTVKFIANTLRSDLDANSMGWITPSGTYQQAPTYGTANSLDSIKVYTNLDGKCIRQFALAHSYFVSSPTSASAPVLASVGGSAVSDAKRLKLTSVTEISGDGTIQKTPYVFTYQEAFRLPRRLSYDQDHWGFCNDSLGTANNYFTPPTFYPNSALIGGSNRHPKWPDMSAFTLTNIQDPLGVNTAFTYEANSANDGVDPDQINSPADTLVGGLRIKQIAVTDNVTGITKIRSFTYRIPGTNTPSGDVRHYPVYTLTMQNEYVQNTDAPNANMGYNTGYAATHQNSTGANGLGVQVLKQSQGIVPMQDASGNHIVYPYVTETFGAGGVGGYKIYHFAEQPETAQSMNSKLLYTDYMAQENMYFGPVVGTQYLYYGNSHFNDTTADSAMLPQNLGYSDVTTSQYYPFAPKQIDVVSGKLLEEDTYDSSNHLLEAVTNTYTTNYHENYWIRGLKVYIQNLIPKYYSNVNGALQEQDDYPALFNAMTFYKLHTGISHLTSTTKKTYNGASYVTETTNYSYDSPYHTLQTTETTTSSQGDTYTKQTYYSFDYANTATGDNIFGKMKARHILEPVNSSTWKNGSLLDAKITQYQDYATASPDTLIYPASIYALETTGPLTPTQANETATWAAPLSTLVPNTTYYKSKVALNYDSYNGKLINQQLTANINHAVVWDTHLSVPIAVVDNAYNQAHTVVTSNSSTNTANVTLPSSGGSSQYTFPFTVTGTGTSTATLSFSGNPNTAGNPIAVVNCRITGTLSNGTSYDSGSVQLCICAGSASCSGGTNSKPMGTLSPGSYVLTASYASTPTLYCPVSVSATYPIITYTYSTTGPQQFYYQGFEQSAVTNASPGVYNTGTSHTGNNFWTGAYTVSFTPPADGRTYKITYWYLSGSTWKLMPEQPYTGPTMALTGGTAYDDIRIFPSDAQMTTYTYDTAGNVTSSMDAKGLTTYYEYDALQRLMNVKDKDGNIVKHIDYHYHGQ